MNCDVQELKKRLPDAGQAFLLLDVRTEEELAIAALPGATHVPLHELEARAGELDAWKDGEVIVLCHHGVRSAMARGYLESLGFVSARNLSGGIDAYSREVDSGIPLY